MTGFAYETMLWHCLLDYEVLFQGNFAKDKTYSSRDF